MGDFESKEQLICNPKQFIRQNTYIKQLYGLNFNFTTPPDFQKLSKLDKICIIKNTYYV